MAAGYSEPGVMMTRPAGREGHWNSDGDDDEIVCPFPSVIVDGVAAVQTLAELRTAYPHMTPIIVGSVHQAALLLEGMAFRQSAPSDGVQGFFGRVVNQFSAARYSTDIDPRTYACARSSDIAKTLDAAEAFGVKDWLVARQAENEAAIMEFEDPDDPEAVWPPRGDWPDDVVPASRPSLVKDLRTGKFRDSVIILGIETERPSDIAAHLQFGGWNACPDPHIHVAIARRWGAQFGAIPIGTSNDMIEFSVARPVTDRDTALLVAMEHCLYCSECVDQGGGNIDELAAALFGAGIWSFWWD